MNARPSPDGLWGKARGSLAVEIWTWNEIVGFRARCILYHKNINKPLYRATSVIEPLVSVFCSASSSTRRGMSSVRPAVLHQRRRVNMNQALDVRCRFKVPRTSSARAAHRAELGVVSRAQPLLQPRVRQFRDLRQLRHVRRRPLRHALQALRHVNARKLVKTVRCFTCVCS